MTVAAAIPAAPSSSPPQTEGGEPGAGMADLAGDGRTDFAALLAGLVHAPAADPAPGGAIGLAGPDGGAESTEVPPTPVPSPAGEVQASPTLLVPHSPAGSAEGANARLVLPSRGPVPVEPTVDGGERLVAEADRTSARQRVVATEPHLPAAEQDGPGLGEDVGLVEPDRAGTSAAGDAASPDAPSPPPAASPAELVAADIARQVALHLAPLDDPAASPSPAGGRDRPAPGSRGSASSALVAAPADHSLAGGEEPAASAQATAPLAGLRELVRGAASRGPRGEADGATAGPIGGGDVPEPLTVEGEAVGPARTATPSGEGRRMGPPASGAPAGSASTTAMPSVDATGAREGAVESAGERRAEAASETGPAPVTDAGPATPSALPAHGGGIRDAGPALVRHTHSAPPPHAEPPAATPVPTSHATLDLALGDGTTGRLRVAVRGDVIHATILADGAAAVLLERELPALRRALAERGFAEAQLTVRTPGGDAPIPPPLATVGPAPDRPATGREREEGAPRDARPDRQDPTEDQRSRERRRPPQPEEYP